VWLWLLDTHALSMKASVSLRENSRFDYDLVLCCSISSEDVEGYRPAYGRSGFTTGTKSRFCETDAGGNLNNYGKCGVKCLCRSCWDRVSRLSNARRAIAASDADDVWVMGLRFQEILGNSASVQETSSWSND
jgi:hypothetical protein